MNKTSGNGYSVNDNLTGVRFGKLVVKEKLSPGEIIGGTKWECQCDCGSK